ncbi:hypothetical protein BS78_05G287000 [Paspalum vaginatum]|nr:hypothetical protein BS78_05G287000 [Paspalum vaginatum]
MGSSTDEVQLVQVLESSFVAPSEATPTKGLWLSPLDLMQASRSHTPTVYLYRRTTSSAAADDDDFFDVRRLKASLAKALVSFYPLAGRLGVDGNGRAEISCNGDDGGALFVVARSDHLTVDDVTSIKPSPELRRLVVPRIEPSSVIMGIQVTFFKCGGVAIGAALHHAAIDASSAIHFFQTWSAISRSGAVEMELEHPCHDRTLLQARSPPTVHPDALSVLSTNLTLMDPPAPIDNAVFAISRDQVASLKLLCGGASTFCAVSALVWQCVCAVRRLPPDSEARLTFPVNIRRKVTPPLPDRYFGNALIRVCATGAAREIAGEEALAAVARRIRGVIAETDDELVRSAIDYFEMEMTGTGGGARNSQMARGSLPETDIQIISWLGTPMYDADFGWGSPQVMSRAESVRGGFVYIMSDDGAGSGGGVRVLVSMEAENIKEMERLLYAKL